MLVGTGCLTIVPGRRLLHQSEAGGLWGVELDGSAGYPTCWWSTRAMIGVATEPPSFLEFHALKRTAPVSPVAAVAATGGPSPPVAAVARAYVAERAPAEGDDAAEEQLRAMLSELLQIRAQEPSENAQFAAAAINWTGHFMSGGLHGMAELGTAGLEAALGKFKVTVEPTPTPATVGAWIEPPTLTLTSPSAPPSAPPSHSTLTLHPHSRPRPRPHPSPLTFTLSSVLTLTHHSPLSLHPTRRLGPRLRREPTDSRGQPARLSP